MQENEKQTVGYVKRAIESQGRKCGISYKRNGSISNLVLTIPLSKEGFIPYQHKQLTLNRIRGLLPVRFMDCGDERHYCYDITSTIPVTRYLSLGKHDDIILLSILKQLCSVAVSCDNYLLAYDCLVFEPDFVFIDPSNLQLKLPYLPYEQNGQSAAEEAEAAFKALVISIITQYNGSYDSKIIRILSIEIDRDNFCIPDFKRRIERLLEDNYLPKTAAQSVRVLHKTGNTEKAARRKESSAKTAEIKGKKALKIKQLFNFGGIVGNEKRTRKKATDNSEQSDDEARCSADIPIPRREVQMIDMHKGDTYKPSQSDTSENNSVQKHAPGDNIKLNCLKGAVEGLTNGAVDDRTILLTGSMRNAVYFQSLTGNETVEIPLGSESTLIGRKKELADCVIDNKAIGRVHCSVSKREGVFCIKDLNSKNGTYVNNVRLEPEVESVIKNKDIITLANKEYYFICGE